LALRPEQLEQAHNRQVAAAQERLGKARLIAGPGTGKSSSIEERVRWLIQDQGISPAQIFVVSFTRVAATELRDNIHNYCERHGAAAGVIVSVSTLHSLGLRILRAAGQIQEAYPVDPVVLDDWELENIFEIEFAKDSGVTRSRAELIRREHEAFWSTGVWDPPNYIPPDPPISDQERRRFIEFHGPRTQVYACVLPGEIVRKCVEGVTAGTLDPAALLHAEHLIVDEFQDLNPCDIELVQCFANQEVATYVAGDDDQSIYSFRFASPRGIQEFLTAGAPGDHRLESCFRSSPEILRTAGSLIMNHSPPERIAKNLVSMYGLADPPFEGIVHRWRFASSQAEARAIAGSCSNLISAGIAPRDILILLSNTDLTERLLYEMLDEAEVPHVRRPQRQFIDSDVGRALLSVLRIACEKSDYVSYRSLLGLFNGIGPGTCTTIARKVILNNLNFQRLFWHDLPGGVFAARERTALTNVKSLLESMAAWGPEDSLGTRRAAIRAKVAAVCPEESLADTDELLGRLPEEAKLRECRDLIWAASEEQRLAIAEAVHTRLGNPLPEVPDATNRVRVLTMHGAKGLSARVVLIPALEAEVIPGDFRRPYPGLVLEAARLLYIAITRARAAAILSYSGRRMIYGQSTVTHPSSFCTNLGGPFVFRTTGLGDQDAARIAVACSNL